MITSFLKTVYVTDVASRGRFKTTKFEGTEIISGSFSSCHSSRRFKGVCVLTSLNCRREKKHSLVFKLQRQFDIKIKILNSEGGITCRSQNKMGFPVVFSWTQEVNRLRNLGYSLLATARSTEAGAQPPGFTVIKKKTHKLKNQDDCRVINCFIYNLQKYPAVIIFPM